MTANWPDYLIYSSDNPPAIIVKQTKNNLVMSLTDSWQWHSAFYDALPATTDAMSSWTVIILCEIQVNKGDFWPQVRVGSELKLGDSMKAP